MLWKTEEDTKVNNLWTKNMGLEYIWADGRKYEGNWAQAKQHDHTLGWNQILNLTLLK